MAKNYIKIRPALRRDAEGISRVLRAITEFTGRDRPSDVSTVIDRYLDYPSLVQCVVAEDDTDRVVGFQSLILAVEGNPYDVPPGWGIIGTHIDPAAHRQGIGSALFRASVEAAKQAEIEKIDAYIAADSAMALRYYEAMGFKTYRQLNGIVQKVFTVQQKHQ